MMANDVAGDRRLQERRTDAEAVGLNRRIYHFQWKCVTADGDA